jgi:hypothetical protein
MHALDRSAAVTAEGIASLPAFDSIHKRSKPKSATTVPDFHLYLCTHNQALFLSNCRRAENSQCFTLSSFASQTAHQSHRRMINRTIRRFYVTVALAKNVAAAKLAVIACSLVDLVYTTRSHISAGIGRKDCPRGTHNPPFTRSPVRRGRIENYWQSEIFCNSNAQSITENYP